MCSCGHYGSNAASQSLDELEFERGLWSAAQYGDLDRAKSLLNKGFYVDQRDAAGYTALHYAVRNGQLKICQLLIENGADINAKTCHGQATALHRAAAAGKYEIVEYLIKKRAKILLQDSDGKNPLHRAAENQHYQICTLLINTEPLLKDSRDNRNNRPIDYVRSEELTKLLNFV